MARDYLKIVKITSFAGERRREVACADERPRFPPAPLRLADGRRGRFTSRLRGFVALVGPRTAAVLGEPWHAIAAALDLDRGGQIARAMATQDTWSGLAVAWPVDDGSRRLMVELSGLPVFDRDRCFSRLSRLRRLPRSRARDDRRRGRRATSRKRGAVPPASGRRNGAGLEPGRAPRLSGTVPPADRATERARRRARRRRARQPSPPLPPQPRRRRLSVRRAQSDCPPTRRRSRPSRTTRARYSISCRSGSWSIGLDHLLYANPAFLRWSGHETLDGLAESGGLDSPCSSRRAAPTPATARRSR